MWYIIYSYAINQLPIYNKAVRTIKRTYIQCRRKIDTSKYNIGAACLIPPFWICSLTTNGNIVDTIAIHVARCCKNRIFP